MMFVNIGTSVHIEAAIRHDINVFKTETNNDPNVEPAYATVTNKLRNSGSLKHEH